MVSFAGAHFPRGCLTCFGGCSHYVQGTGASPLLRSPALGMNSEFYSRVAPESSRVQLGNFRNICTGGYSVPATVGNPEGRELYFHLSMEMLFICDQTMGVWGCPLTLRDVTKKRLLGKLPVATVTMEAVFPYPWFLLEILPLGSLYRYLMHFSLLL